MKESSIVTTLRMSPDRRQILKTLAVLERKNMKDIIDEMIDRYAEEHKETLEILSRPDWIEQIKKSEKKFKRGETISHEELGKRLRLED